MEKKRRILLVDDDLNILEVLKMRLEFKGYEVVAVSDPEEALDLFQEEDFDVVITDQRMDRMTGLELMLECQKVDPTIQVILFTAYGSIEQAVETVKAGAFSYVTKPVDHRDLALKIEKAIEKRDLLRQVANLKQLVVEKFIFEDMIGESPKMKAVFRQIMAVAPTESTVTIYGESGTGKELVAKAIHVHSPRAKGPFVAVNCAAIPETLLEDELFGHLKGAYTGAVGSKVGLFVQAHRGTLFLDEVGEMSEAMQAKLLRVVETGEVRPLGSDQTKKVDVRLIVATKRDLKQMVDEGRFREDLYYRIHVVPIHLPPLRERREDIPLLMRHFFEKFSQKMGKRIETIESEVVDLFVSYHWPGNVRELENLIEYLTALAPGKVINKAMLANTPLLQEQVPIELKPLREAKDQFVKRYLEDLFRLTKGNVSRAARLAGYYRADFYKLFQKYGLDPKKYRHRSQALTVGKDLRKS
ncbi:sigma-54-dependent transcriptional regulator [Thermosulfuriphilus sp.]